ncbi:hypothetical protein [Pseudorhodobacter wandonensis]|uniref:hypothetical protein n=1 Tax=Pseudorhodobacter wandonensis TaxID=1120568 RepID=UPI00067B4E20|nr:hypothetical protein [Pseudorhodobacter wandonensis]
MTNHMPNLSTSAAMVADEPSLSLPPYAPLAMPKQILASDLQLFSFVAAVLNLVLSALKPGYRSAN